MKKLIIVWIIPVLLLVFTILLFLTNKIAGVLFGAIFLAITGVVSVIALIISLIILLNKKVNKWNGNISSGFY